MSEAIEINGIKINQPSDNKKYIVGMMSGTSLDAVDAVLVDAESSQIIDYKTKNIPNILKEKLFFLNTPSHNDLHLSKLVEAEVTECYAETFHSLVKKAGIDSKDVICIGAHGQTIRHEPNIDRPYTLQLLNGAKLSYETKTTVVCDFRSKDIAAGGQGAPLAPIFHQAVFDVPLPFVVANIGGIANVSLIAENSLTGFDTGPGNCLLDEWIKEHKGKAYDKDGKWAAKGKVALDLLAAMLSDAYFAKASPKSTGRDYFNLRWLSKFRLEKYSQEDVMRTLVRLTAQTIVEQLPMACNMLLISGGGAKNEILLRDIALLAEPVEVKLCTEVGLNSQYLEAFGFAWLAGKTIRQDRVANATITGAAEDTILGAIHFY